MMAKLLDFGGGYYSFLVGGDERRLCVVLMHEVNRAGNRCVVCAGGKPEDKFVALRFSGRCRFAGRPGSHRIRGRVWQPVFPQLMR